MKTSIIFLVMTFLLSACATGTKVEDLPVPADQVLLETAPIEKTIAPNEIRPGHTLTIKHSLDKKLSGQFVVNSDGSLLLPYGKKFQTKEKTTSDLADELAVRYSSLFKSGNTFQVAISIRNLLVDIRGLVKRPGSLTVRETTTLEEIIARAEVDKTEADYVRIELDGLSQWIDLKQYNSGLWPIEKMPKWLGGESIWFVKGGSNFAKGTSDIRIMGEVNQPGTFSFQKGKAVLDYVTLAGGLKSSANLEKVYLYRPHENTQKVAHFSVLDPQKFQLVPGDTILVTSERQENIERKIQMGTNLATILSAIGILILAL